MTAVYAEIEDVSPAVIVVVVFFRLSSLITSLGLHPQGQKDRVCTMALSRTRFNLAATTYHQSKISDRFQLLITKKEVECDYVAVDATALVATALRLAKNVSTEQRRHKEVARHVAQSLQQLLKRIRCKKSLLIALDGAEGLLKAERTRSSNLTRKVESRLMRLPGTQLIQAVEERIVRMMPDRQILPSEVVFCGTCVQGCVEQKMSAWALDLASLDSFNGSTDTLCLIGASELYLNVMALSPFYNVSSIVQNNADMRHLRLQDVLEWLELDKKAKEGESVMIAKMRTDILFLFILANGASATELNPVPGIGFHELVDCYMKIVGESNTDASGSFLFDDCPGNTIRLNIPLLSHLMQLVLRREVPPRMDAMSEFYLEHALQTHTMLCLGESLQCDHLPPASMQQMGVSTPGASQFTGHLNALRASSVYRIANRTAPRVHPLIVVEAEKASILDSTAGKEVAEKEVKKRGGKGNEQRPLTAAEYTILCQSVPAAVEALIQNYIGVAPKPEVGKMITTADTAGAHRLVREVLSYANPTKPHKCLCLSPSYCWLQNEKSKLWRFEYVDIGLRSHRMETRRHRNAVKGLTFEISMSRDGPSHFVRSSVMWEPIPSFPCGAEQEIDGDRHALSSSSILEGVAADEAKEEDMTLQLVGKTPETSMNDALMGKNTEHLPHRGGGTERMVSSNRATLKVLTWNVMFDRYSGKPTPLGMPGIDWCSPKRYPVLSKIIEQEDADVVGMQEVEPVFWEFLAKQPWMQERYFFSCGHMSPAISPWGVLMLVHRRRFPVLGITYLNVPAWTNHVSLMPVVSLQVQHGVVHVAAAHLLAPYTKSHETARTSQDSALRHHMTKTLSGDVLMMGDFNDWPTNEFLMPSESQYVDCWPVLHPKDAGKTMDETNTFCKLKVEEMFFGRSDKMFLRSRRLVPLEAHLVGTKSVNDENGNTNAPGYLFPSDHYGVSMTFALKQR